MGRSASFTFAGDSLEASRIERVVREIARTARLEVWRDRTDGALRPGDVGFLDAENEPHDPDEPLSWRFEGDRTDAPAGAIHFTRDDDACRATIYGDDVNEAFEEVYESIKAALSGVEDEL